MGIKGAAIATLISQLFNLVFIAVGFALCIRKDGDKPVWSLRFSKITVRDYLIMIMPILVSEFLWSLGQNVESAVYGHLGTSNLAAYTLTCPIQGLIGIFHSSGRSIYRTVPCRWQRKRAWKDTADCVCLQRMYLSGELWVCIHCLPRKKYSGWLYR